MDLQSILNGLGDFEELNVELKANGKIVTVLLKQEEDPKKMKKRKKKKALMAQLAKVEEKISSDLREIKEAIS